MPCSCGGVGDGVGVLQVVGDDHAGDGALGERDPAGAVDQVADLRRARWPSATYSCATSLNRRRQVDLLLVVAAEAGARLLADDRQHRLVVELGVVEAVEQVDRAGPRGGQADAELAGELGVGARHERGHLLVAHLDELGAARAVARALERADDAVDAVARDSRRCA